ncbi:collagen alpha-1(III) chain-like [Strigops habroptila]|uniref:collagen alpha-1(III) chain-like n=1 Tax=Strigops habroptila TaxID=2489341 RepID=UPI0011CFB3F2|nr:collagen alpha-1(III) chain-like [Strigops habroptila]
MFPQLLLSLHPPRHFPSQPQPPLRCPSSARGRHRTAPGPPLLAIGCSSPLTSAAGSRSLVGRVRAECPPEGTTGPGARYRSQPPGGAGTGGTEGYPAERGVLPLPGPGPGRPAGPAVVEQLCSGAGTGSTAAAPPPVGRICVRGDSELHTVCLGSPCEASAAGFATSHNETRSLGCTQSVSSPAKARTVWAAQTGHSRAPRHDLGIGTPSLDDYCGFPTPALGSLLLVQVLAGFCSPVLSWSNCQDRPLQPGAGSAGARESLERDGPMDGQRNPSHAGLCGAPEAAGLPVLRPTLPHALPAPAW